MAEMERKRDSKQKEKPMVSDEEKQRKLQKLMELKTKLAELEKEESQEKPQNIQPPPEKIEILKKNDSEEDKFLDSVENDLSELEDNLSNEIDEIDFSKIDAHDEEVEKISNKLTNSSKSQSQVKLSPQQEDELEKELAKLQEEINKEADKNAIKISIFDQLCEEHSWLKEPQYGFMYSMPDKKKNKKDFDSWLDDWNKVLFDYARIASKHIIYSKLLLSEKPWSELKNRIDSVSEITESMVKNKVAEWLDKKKEKLRIYWKSLEDWADAIVKWAKEMAITEPILIQDIQEAEQPFSNLPEEDYEKIFNIISKNGQGIKHKLSTGQSAITIKF